MLTPDDTAAGGELTPDPAGADRNYSYDYGQGNGDEHGAGGGLTPDPAGNGDDNIAGGGLTPYPAGNGDDNIAGGGLTPYPAGNGGDHGAGNDQGDGNDYDGAGGDDRSRFGAGELALFLDRKGRSYQVALAAGAEFHTHLGILAHDAVIGQAVGGWYATSRGHILLGIRPTLGDYVRLMPRGPQVIYAKDLGNIVAMADIFPGARVVEAGLGSGALTTALLRAVGEKGRVHSYEINPDAVPKALSNVRSVIPDTSRLQVTVGDVAEGIADAAVDRVILDLPEPWRAVNAVAEALQTGGILLSFLPTILQVQQLTLALQDDGRFARIATAETLLRGWNVTQRSVRPAHRMVAHSGFITTAVRCLPPSRQGYTPGV